MKKIISTLTFKVLILIVLAVLPVNVFLIISTMRATEELYRQTELSLQNTADLYINTLDMEMERTAYYLYSQYNDNPDFITLCGTTGYLPNPSEAAIADTWHGPYRVLGNPHPGDESHTSYHSQISFILTCCQRCPADECSKKK